MQWPHSDAHLPNHSEQAFLTRKLVLTSPLFCDSWGSRTEPRCMPFCPPQPSSMPRSTHQPRRISCQCHWPLLQCRLDGGFFVLRLPCRPAGTGSPSASKAKYGLKKQKRRSLAGPVGPAVALGLLFFCGISSVLSDSCSNNAPCLKRENNPLPHDPLFIYK